MIPNTPLRRPAPLAGDALDAGRTAEQPIVAITSWMFQALLANLDGMVYRCRN